MPPPALESALVRTTTHASDSALVSDGAPNRVEPVAFWLMCGVTALLVLILARVIQLQLIPGARLEEHIDARVLSVPQPGVRGDLLDRRGQLLSATRFGSRVFIDPVELVETPDAAAKLDEHLTTLSEVTGLSVQEIAERLLPKIAENERRTLPARDDDPWTEPDPAKPEIRYVSLGGVLEDWRAEIIRGLGIKGVHLETRSVRESPAADLAGSLLGTVGIDHNGLLGAELMLERAVKPVAGSLRYVHDAKRRPLWVQSGGYAAPLRGEDVRLSIDLTMQQMAVEELARGVEECDAAGGRLVAMDPSSGEILAIVDLIREVPAAVEYTWEYPIGQEPGGVSKRYKTILGDAKRGTSPNLARNRCVEDAYEPGSTFKPFVWATATELGRARPDDVIDTEGGTWRTSYGRLIEDVVDKPSQTWREVLVNSSNIGMIKVGERLSFAELRAGVVRFGFGSRTNIGLPGESFGVMTPPKRWSKFTQTSVCYGHEVAVTPIQMARAFSVFARDGEAAGTMPIPRLLAAEPEALEQSGLRVLPSWVAMLTREAMRGVTAKLDERLAKSNDPEPLLYEAFGKSGTAEIPLGPPPKGKRRPRGSDGYFQGQYNASFVAGAPFESPRLVVVVVIDDPGPERVRARTHYGSATAGPVARRFLEKSLSYLGVPVNSDRIPGTLAAQSHP